MECSEPGAIRDEELVAYQAGEKVRPAVVEHLARCQGCSSRVAGYQQIEQKLKKKLYRWDCPPSQVLGEYQLGLLDAPLVAAVNMHLRTCVLCSAEVATLTQFLANDPFLVEPAPALQREKVVQVSPSGYNHVVRETKQAIEHLRDQALLGARRIVATLLPPPQPGFALQRNPTRQVAQWPRNYIAEDTYISLQLESSPKQRDTLQLIGFVTDKGMVVEDLQGTPVQLVAQNGAVYTQQIDSLGNFVFSALTTDIYTLEILFPTGVVVIDQIPVQPVE